MRQPKFRGFSPETNEWVYGYGWHETDYTDDFLRSINQSRQDAVLFTKTFPITCDIESMGEFTGLLDTNGVEIYEGDIVRHATDEGIYKVIFDDGGFYVKNLFEYDFQTIDEYPLEVIGNTYEYIELLKKTE
ncbi:YopX family protein [Heyndrickxia sporothermodurans]|uniref:YopX family protein n=1 Tax=Heyndrickxia sporothermodurans TaxID=46224 RepID=UPI0035DD062A